MIQKVNPEEKFSLFNEHWSPKIANLRDQQAIVLNEGESVIILHGVEHQPVADQKCRLILLELITPHRRANASLSWPIRNAA